MFVKFIYPNELKKSISAIISMGSLLNKNASKRACYYRCFCLKTASYLLAIISDSSVFLSIGVFCALSLGGCTIYNNNPQPIKWEAKAERSSQVVTIRFNSGSSVLGSRTKKKIAALISQPKDIYCRLYKTHQEIDTLRMKALRYYLESLGVPSNNIEVLDQETNNSPHHLTLLIDSYHILKPQCPGWNQPMTPFTPTSGEINFKCTSERNFAAMIADPRTLIAGIPLGNRDANRSSQAVEAYRVGKVKELKVEKIETSQ